MATAFIASDGLPNMTAIDSFIAHCRDTDDRFARELLTAALCRVADLAFHAGRAVRQEDQDRLMAQCNEARAAALECHSRYVASYRKMLENLERK